MANRETIAQLPYDVADVTSMKRFLRELVDNLDSVLGFKGDNKYVTDNDFKAQGLTVGELTEQTKSNTEVIDDVQETAKEHSDELLDMQEQLDALNTVLTAAPVDTIYRDFNNPAWSMLIGKVEFSALGSDLVNPPAAVSGTDTYTVLVDSTKTSTTVWQTVVLTTGTTINIYSRIGVNSNWVRLNN